MIGLEGGKSGSDVEDLKPPHREDERLPTEEKKTRPRSPPGRKKSGPSFISEHRNEHLPHQLWLQKFGTLSRVYLLLHVRGGRHKVLWTHAALTLCRREKGYAADWFSACAPSRRARSWVCRCLCELYVLLARMRATPTNQTPIWVDAATPTRSETCIYLPTHEMVITGPGCRGETLIFVCLEMINPIISDNIRPLGTVACSVLICDHCDGGDGPARRQKANVRHLRDQTI